MKFQRIQDLRTDADLSQRELSEILHISQRSYSHYETGSRNIPIEMAYVAESYYGDTLSFYREEVGEGEYDIEVRKNGTEVVVRSKVILI